MSPAVQDAERVHLYALALGLEQRHLGALDRLEALAAGDPGLIALERLGERQHLADFAAAVGIAREQEFLGIFGVGQRLRPARRR